MFKSALHRHGRFLISFAFGVVLWALCLQTSLNFFTRALVGVNGFFVAYVLLMFHLIRQASAEDLRRHSEEDDEGAGLIVFLSVSTVIVEPGEAGRGRTVISLTIRAKPIGANTNRTDFALAA
jgi:uncharacterized membrane protein